MGAVKGQNRERRVITAQEAKNVSDKAEKMIHIIMRNIEEEAEMGKNHFLFHLEDASEEAVKNAYDALVDAGFTVNVGWEDTDLGFVVPNVVSKTAIISIRW